MAIHSSYFSFFGLNTTFNIFATQASSNDPIFMLGHICSQTRYIGVHDTPVMTIRRVLINKWCDNLNHMHIWM